MMDDDADHGMGAGAGLEPLPLRLVFDLGERAMTLGELQSLQVGQSLDLGRPLSSSVTLRVNGAQVGTGELVEIDGRLGVTISALCAPGAGIEAASVAAPRASGDSDDDDGDDHEDFAAYVDPFADRGDE